MSIGTIKAKRVIRVLDFGPVPLRGTLSAIVWYSITITMYLLFARRNSNSRSGARSHCGNARMRRMIIVCIRADLDAYRGHPSVAYVNGLRTY